MAPDWADSHGASYGAIWRRAKIARDQLVATDVQPVFATTVQAAQKLCTATSANLLTVGGQLLHLAAFAKPTPGSRAPKGKAIRGDGWKGVSYPLLGGE